MLKSVENVVKLKLKLKELKPIYRKAQIELTTCDSDCDNCSVRDMCNIMLELDELFRGGE